MFPLELWREYFGFHPWHFWQMSNNRIPISSECNGLTFEHAWQNHGAVGRAEIRSALRSADRLLREGLGFDLLAKPKAKFWRNTFRSRSAKHRVEPELRKLGATRLGALGTIEPVLSDRDSDGILESFTATLTVDFADNIQTDEIRVYFIDSDRGGQAVGERWQIQPLDVTVEEGDDETTITISGKAWLLAKPLRYERLLTPLTNKKGLDPSLGGILADRLNVYREHTISRGTTLEDAEIVFLWHSDPTPTWATRCDATGLGIDRKAIAYAIGHASIKYERFGDIEFSNEIYNAENDEWINRHATDYFVWSPPDAVLIRYIAGLSDDFYAWQDVYARLAAAELSKPICACEGLNQELYRWQFDRARAGGRMEEQFTIGQGDLNNPFGTRAGHIYAWNRVKHLQLINSFSI